MKTPIDDGVVVDARNRRSWNEKDLCCSRGKEYEDI